jgi:hypothetical protein
MSYAPRALILLLAAPTAEFNRHPGINDIEEADGLLMAMTLHALAEHLAFKNVECSKALRVACMSAGTIGCQKHDLCSPNVFLCGCCG